MFMIPHAADDKRDRRNRRQHHREGAGDGSQDLGNLGGVLHGEVGLLTGGNAMPFEQQLSDLLLRLLGDRDRAGRGEDHVDIVEFRTIQPLADGGVGDQDDVVLVFPHHVRPLALEHPDHAERDVPDADGLPHRVGRLEQLGHQGVPNDADLRGRRDVPVGEETTRPQVPVSHNQVIGPHATDLAGAGVGVAVDHLPRETDNRTGRQDGRAFPADGGGILGGEGGNRSLPDPLATAGAGKDHDDVGPQLFELPLHKPAGTLTERDHCRDGGNANHHSQHGQPRPHLVFAEGPQGNSERDQEVHGIC